MTTWGQPKKRSKTTTTAKRPPAKAAPAKTAAASTSSRRGQASAELRQAVEGREHEFAGIGFIVAGVLLGMAIYLDLAGPVGRGVETLVGWFTGLGRFILPIALISIGIALIRKGESMHRFRLAIGWGLLGLALLGLLHVVRGPDKIMADFDTLGKAGGWIGALVGEPLRSLIASGGAIVVLVAACVGGALVLTRASLRSLLSNTGKGVGAVAVPIGRKARTAFGNISTLK
ncbi:MAG TPA: DNA translocase FtsK 4TM domain-containing protein, partial [Ilumatobacteraceae bacterium]